MSEWSDVQAGRAAGLVIVSLAAAMIAITALILLYATRFGYSLYLP